MPLTVILQFPGDDADNTTTVSRDAAGYLYLNGAMLVKTNGTPLRASDFDGIRMLGEGGDDTLTYDDSNGPMPPGELRGGTGNDTLTGSSAGDKLCGEDNNDRLFGRAGNDILEGGALDDVLIGGLGDDQMYGGTFSDRMIVNPGDGFDRMDGGDGLDYAEINGDDGNEQYTITTNVHHRTLVSRAGFAAYAQEISDTEVIEINAKGGDDTIAASVLEPIVSLSVDGGDGNDTISGGNNADFLEGGDGDDVVRGGAGADTVALGAGDDTFFWELGEGSDEVKGGGGSDTFQLEGSFANDFVALSANGTGRAIVSHNFVPSYLQEIEHVQINAYGGQNTVWVNDLTGTGITQVDIDLAPLIGGPGPLTIPPDEVLIHATEGTDAVVVTPGVFASVAVTGLAARVDIRQSEADADNLIIATDGGNDTVTVGDGDLASVVNLTVLGGTGNDTLTGNATRETLFGEDNDDTLSGRGGNDTLNGGDGNDLLIGGLGDDHVFGADDDDRMIMQRGDGYDVMDGGDAFDVAEIHGSDEGEALYLQHAFGRTFAGIAGLTDFGADIGTTEVIEVHGHGGDDTLTSTGIVDPSVTVSFDGGEGNDWLLGGTGNDILKGGDGDDNVQGRRGNDVAHLGAGNDTYVWNYADGRDQVDGGSGFDTFRYVAGHGDKSIKVFADGDGGANVMRDFYVDTTNALDRIERIEIVTYHGDSYVWVTDLTGTAVTQVDIDLAPQFGGSTDVPDSVLLEGTQGSDVIDIRPTAAGTVTVTGLAARVDIHESEAAYDNLSLVAGAGNDTISAAAGDLASAVNLYISGGAGNDTITGGNGDDDLVGDEGNDVVRGGLGNDGAYLGDGDDTFVWNHGDGSDEVEGGAGVDRLDVNGSDAAENYHIAAHGQRVMFSRDVATVSLDLLGIETIDLDAGGGDDSVIFTSLVGTGVTGPLTVALGLGDDYLDASLVTASAIVTGGAGNDHVIGGRGADVLQGGADNDALVGGDGNDELRGGAGNDSVEGGIGTDTAFFSGRRSDYHIALNASGFFQVTDLRAGSPDGIDIVQSVEFLAFSDGTIPITAALNAAPTIVSNGSGSSATVTVTENTTQVTTVAASDPNAGTVLTYSIVGGADAARFQINATTGAVSFIAAPDFEAPTDAGSNNRYDVVVRASDGIAFDDQAIAVNVTNVAALNLTGDAGDNYLVGSSENDFLNGLAGNDRLVGGLGADILNGGAGADTADYLDGAAVTVDLAAGTASNGSVDTLTSIERVVGSQFADTIRGSSVDNVIDGASGNDVLEGHGGNDRLEGGAGNDRLNGGDGNDEVIGQGGNDTLDGANGNDLVRGGDGDDNIEGRDGNDRLEGEAGADTIDAGAGNDLIFGGNGNDRLFAAGGTDTVTGGAGNDMFYYTNPGSGQMNGDTITDFQSVAGQNTGDLLVIRSGYSGLVLNNGSTAITYNGVTETLYHPGVTLSLANDIMVV